MRFFAYIYRPHKDVGVDVEFEESTNVIRIETEDDSGDYIEIILPDDTGNNVDDNDDELNTLLNEAKDILYEISPLSSVQSDYDNLKASEYKEALLDAITILPIAKVLKAKKTADKINKIISKDKSKKDVRIKGKGKSKYATRQEVIEAIKKKYELKNSNELKKEGHKGLKNSKNVYWAKDSKKIKEIWEDITERAEVLKDKIDGYGNILQRRKLSDGTIIQLRKKSSGGTKAKKEGKGGTGGSTIEIGKTKIHNRAGEDGNW